MPDFPSAIYDPVVKENVPKRTYDATKVTRIFAEDFNIPNEEIIAIEETLGTNPQGAYDTVSERIAAVEGGGGAVDSVNGQTGVVVLDAGDVGAEPTLGFTPEDVGNKKTAMAGNTTSNIFYLSAKAIYDWAVGTFETALGFTPENVANKETSALDTSVTKYPNNAVVKSAVDAKQNSLGFTAENVSNKDTNTALGTSDTAYPSQKAVKTYVDNNYGNVFTTIVKKSADQDVTNNATLQDDTELQLAILTGEVWKIEFLIAFCDNNTTGSYKCSVVGPSCEGSVKWVGSDNNNLLLSTGVRINGATLMASTSMSMGANLTDIHTIRIEIEIIALANGTVKFQFANAAASSGRISRTKAGSTMWAKKVLP